LVIVDTNILAYLMIEGDRTAAARQLRSRDPDWRSEAFIMVELSNLLATYIRTRVLARDRALRLLAEAHSVVPVLVTVPHSRALEAAAEFGISAYDGRFIALAMQSRQRLVTEDSRLLAASPRWTVSLTDAVRA
jgi:predicted nucleic acid-binding protein